MRLLPAVLALSMAAGPAIAEDTNAGGRAERAVSTIVIDTDMDRDIVPDTARISLQVVVDASRPAEAAAQNAELSRRVLVKARELDIAPDDFATRDVRVEQIVEQERDAGSNIVRQVLKGYRASATFNVTIRDVRKAAASAQALMAAGANRFDGVRFSYSKEADVREDLRVAALVEAKRRALRYAEALGLHLGRAMEVLPEQSERSESYADLAAPQPGVAEAATFSIPLEPGTINLQAKVRITWEVLS